MKLLMTGATGVLGMAAVPVLVSSGWDVTAVARSSDQQRDLDRMGARPVEMDLFEPADIAHKVAGVDAVVHFATAIPPYESMKQRSSWDTNDRLRDHATALLVEASIAAGVSRFVQQSVTFSYADGGTGWLDESSPIEPVWDVLDSSLAAEAHVARFAKAGGAGVVLRLSRLYGPGRASAEYVWAARERQLPIIGSGRNYVSSLHVDDAATALRAALTVPPGVYNVTDDRPVSSADYNRSLAAALGAPKPRRVPEIIARASQGDVVKLLTISHRVSNQRFVKATRWSPTYSSVLDGWEDVVSRDV